MKSMAKGDQISGLVLLGISVWLALQSSRMPQAADFGPGVGFLPFWLSIIMAGLSILLIVNGTRKPADASATPILPTGVASKRVLIVLVSLVGYVALLNVLGFVLDTILFIGFLLRGLERESWKNSIIIAIGAGVVLYLIFQIGLGVRLPANFLGF